MQTDYYKSREEQVLWDFIKDKAIVDVSALKQTFSDYSNAKINRIMASLNRKKFVKRIMRDRYLVNFGDMHKIALQLWPGYLGLTSALRVYNLMDYEDFIIYVITFNKTRKVDVGQYTLKYISLKKKAIGYKAYDGLSVSTIEKTFFDLFYLHRLFSYDLITKAIYDCKNIDWKEFIAYYRKFATDPMCQRTGYILELLKKRTRMKIPKLVFDYLKSRVKQKTKLVNTAAASKFNKTWLIQDNVGEKKILGWWFS